MGAKEISEIVAGHHFRLDRAQAVYQGAPYPGTACPGRAFRRRPDSARGTLRRACAGRSTPTGSHLGRVDGTGCTTTGGVRDGVLHDGHLVLYKEEQS
ncbi:Atu4866 domain-containing protein [Streptomyces sp. 21So2-11]|uniref:Atu4866 domain-containing protein n=1 Tax=Streptomyces sp. 21So2-11 TaxID=3144408 RepID=UPI0032193CBF